MCTIDALGVPPMLGGDVMVSSADPLTGAPVSVTFRGGHASSNPPGWCSPAARASLRAVAGAKVVWSWRQIPVTRVGGELQALPGESVVNALEAVGDSCAEEAVIQWPLAPILPPPRPASPRRSPPGQMTSVIDAVLAGGDGDGAVGGHDADLAGGQRHRRRLPLILD
jgi:hypothetical protein